MTYKEFLKNKEIIDNSSGFSPAVVNGMLFDFQSAIVKWACKRGRAAIFADCGLGKTPMQLEWSNKVFNHTGNPVIIIAPLAVSKQTKREGEKFGISVNICESQDDVVNGINITNYEKLHKFDCGSFSGVVLDESSILKSYTGKFKNFIIESFKQTPYKLACTATPAPNDFEELGNHSEFLNVMTRSEMLSMFFINDTANVGTWRLKGHGAADFWKWICSWSVMLSRPSDLGFKDNGFILPALHIHEHVIEFGKPMDGHLFALKAETLQERREARRESIKEKIEVVKGLTNNDETFLVWCDLNRESEEIAKGIPDAFEVTGSQEESIKESRIMGFINGEHRIIVSKPSIMGFGLNLQHCSNVIFFGLSDSYEQFYQAIRRCWRFGQKKDVNCHIITTDIEGNVVDNVKRKESDVLRMREEMIKNMSDISTDEIRQVSHTREDYKVNSYHGSRYELHLGDNVELIKNIKSDSIGLSIFSPPFASLFTYSNSIRDMGNCKGKEDFLGHFKYLAKELYRVTMPGRLVCIHCMNLPKTIQHDGCVGIYDFRGDIIRLFESESFVYHSEVCIWKDPLVQAVRTKVLSLAHKQVVKDSSRCAQGLADYIVVMRKQGVNPVPISRKHGFSEYIGEREFTKTGYDHDQRKNKLSHEIWQRYASPVWFDIRQTRVLSAEIARDEKDEKHVCLARESLILTRERGYVPIYDISIGESVLTHKGKWKPVIAKKCTGINPVIQTKAQGVASLITTPDHKLWTRKPDKVRAKDYMPQTSPEWIEARNVKGAWVNLKLPDIEPSELTHGEWWIVGRYLADGHMGTRGDFHISVGKHKKDEFEAMAYPHAGFFAEHEALQYRMRGLSENLKTILRKCGRGAENKQVPIEGICLDKESSTYLLNGYLSGDGNKTGNATSASSVSRALLLGMAMVAQRALGVIPSVFAGKPEGKHIIQGREVNQKQGWVMSWRESAHHQFGAILEDGAWKKVAEIEDVGTSETWSIQVADDESFTAEGCIIKNCPLQLDTIERCLELWSCKGDTVLDPFSGIGSTVYSAVSMGRYGIGIELKESYWKQSIRNLEYLESQEKQAVLL